MFTELLNNLIYPIIYTAIGAGIGGWFAYSLARQQYSRDRLNETIGFVFLLKRTADKIAKSSKEMSKYIERFDGKSTADSIGFLYVVMEKHLEVNTDLLRLIQQWETCKESVSLCSSKLVCKNLEIGKNIERLEDNLSNTSFKIQSYERLYETFKKKYDEESAKSGFDINNFLDTGNSRQELRDASEYLAKISALCEEISEIYEKLEKCMPVKSVKFL